MAFFGDYFVYDGIPCTEFGLRLLEVNGEKAESCLLPSPVIVVEPPTMSRHKNLFYGAKYEEPLVFSLVVGLDQKRGMDNQYFNACDREEIAMWLDSSKGYKWLEIEQEDMEQVRYKCIIKDIKAIEIVGHPIAFSLRVECDSPFAYYYPELFTCSCANKKQLSVFNRSSVPGVYYPKMRLTINNGGTVSITNHSNKDERFELRELPVATPVHLEVDGENGVLTTSDIPDVYGHFNFSFLGLVCGNNNLEIQGDCSVELQCEFLANVGG